MPKIIDHDKHRETLARNAAPLFSKYGYSGLGMRKIAEELGLSKSALYHYFPNKQALFHASTAAVMRFENPATAPNGDPIDALLQTLKEMEPEFPQEMTLVFDYLRGKTATEISQDSTMQLANARYTSLVKAVTGEKDAANAICLILGVLLMRYFDGGKTSFDIIEMHLHQKISRPE